MVSPAQTAVSGGNVWVEILSVYLNCQHITGIEYGFVCRPLCQHTCSILPVLVTGINSVTAVISGALKNKTCLVYWTGNHQQTLKIIEEWLCCTASEVYRFHDNIDGGWKKLLSSRHQMIFLNCLMPELHSVWWRKSSADMRLNQDRFWVNHWPSPLTSLTPIPATLNSGNNHHLWRCCWGEKLSFFKYFGIDDFRWIFPLTLSICNLTFHLHVIHTYVTAELQRGFVAYLAEILRSFLTEKIFHSTVDLFLLLWGWAVKNMNTSSDGCV